MNSANTTDEPLVAFLDANIVLEGKPVSDLPWEEVATDGTIRVLIVPKAMEEIDAKKRDGRLGVHARAFNQLIAPSVIEGQPVILRESKPRVELRMATCSRIPWEDYDELDPDDGDSRIVAEAINVRDVDSGRRVLISHDIKPLAYARGRNLPVHQPSDAWLRPIEPGPKDKEIQRLKQKVIDLSKDEPSFEISIEISGDVPAKIYKISSLGPDDAEVMTSKILSKNKRTAQSRNQFSLGLDDYDSSYNERYQRYSTEAVPTFVSSIGEKFQIMFNQRVLTVRVRNSGKIRADHMAVSVSVNDGWMNENIIVVSPMGPTAPTLRGRWHHAINMPTIDRVIPTRVGRHEFETTRRAKRATDMEESCEDFRSGQEYRFDGVVVPSTDRKPLEITVSITAANLRGARVEIFKLEKNIIEVPVSDIFDFEEFKVKQDFPVKNEIERLIDQKLFDDIEWDHHHDSN